MHPRNFPAFSTGLKIQSRLLGSFRAGAGGLYFAIFMHGALSGLTAFSLIALLLGGGL
jgi:hypothetical protein